LARIQVSNSALFENDKTGFRIRILFLLPFFLTLINSLTNIMEAERIREGVKLMQDGEKA
jgi:hypothetical protein